MHKVAAGYQINSENRMQIIWVVLDISYHTDLTVLVYV